MNGCPPAADDSPHYGPVTATIPGSGGQAAFTLHLPPDPSPVLVAVPHAGRCYPPALLARMRLPDTATLRLEDRLMDVVAQGVARDTGAALLVAHAPRALIDLNRGPADMDWDMVTGLPPADRLQQPRTARARGGLGLIPRRLAGMGEIWRAPLPPAEVESRLHRVHRPYHAALSCTLARLRGQWGAALLIDLHSMPPLPKERDGTRIHCVVGDRFRQTAAADLATGAITCLQDSGFRTAHNRPYAGGYVLDRHGNPARGIHALQVEVCRSLYLDSELREPAAGLPPLAEALAGMVRRLATDMAAIAGQKLAAE